MLRDREEPLFLNAHTTRLMHAWKSSAQDGCAQCAGCWPYVVPPSCRQQLSEGQMPDWALYNSAEFQPAFLSFAQHQSVCFLAISKGMAHALDVTPRWQNSPDVLDG